VLQFGRLVVLEAARGDMRVKAAVGGVCDVLLRQDVDDGLDATRDVAPDPGPRRYPAATSLTIILDCGGSNGIPRPAIIGGVWLVGVRG
jgi:hypothetical protein